MRRLLASVGATIATAALVTVPSAANADVGDGNINCNRGEICFSDNGGYQVVGVKHFYYDANHWDYNFNNGARLEDGIDGYRNLDTECNVVVFDINSMGGAVAYSYLAPENDNATTWYRTYSEGDRNRNNFHWRCS